MHMSRFQTHAIYFVAAAYLIVGSLGAGGCRLCLRNDGQSLVSPKYAQAYKCKSRHLLCHGQASTQLVDSRPTSATTCSAKGSCFQIPLMMTALGRPSSRTPGMWPDADELLFAAVPQGDCLALPTRATEFFQHGCPSQRFVMTGLRSTILLL